MKPHSSLLLFYHQKGELNTMTTKLSNKILSKRKGENIVTNDRKI